MSNRCIYQPKGAAKEYVSFRCSDDLTDFTKYKLDF